MSMRSSRYVNSLSNRIQWKILFWHRFRTRDYPMMSSSRNGSYSSGGGGGPDRSYPSIRNGYMDARSRPYDSPYERQRMPPPPPMTYSDPYSRSAGDPYSIRSGGVDPYARDDYYHQRAPPMPLPDHYSRGPPMRYVAIHVYWRKSGAFKLGQKKAWRRSIDCLILCSSSIRMIGSLFYRFFLILELVRFYDRLPTQIILRQWRYVLFWIEFNGTEPKVSKSFRPPSKFMSDPTIHRSAFHFDPLSKRENLIAKKKLHLKEKENNR